MQNVFQNRRRGMCWSENLPKTYFYCFYEVFSLFILSKDNLTHAFPMHPFSAPWKHQKTVRFSDVISG